MSIPCELVFHPNWWNKRFGFTFNENYFFDVKTRVKVERNHRKIINKLFGEYGLGSSVDEDRPVMGTVHLAAGFLVSGILGCEINYSASSSPEVIPAKLSMEQISNLEIPDIPNTPIMRKVIAMMDQMEKEYGYVEGDLDWGGILNTALDLRGQEFFMDTFDNPDLVKQYLDVIFETTLKTIEIIKSRTGTSSISVNRIIGKIDPKINLHSNCSVTMISKDMYDEFLLPYELRLADALRPYAIHHCGKDLEKVAESYALAKPVYVDVGWGSDIVASRKALPDAILGLRLDPALMSKWKPEEIKPVISKLIEESGSLEKTALCCINMDATVPDENIIEVLKMAK